jgi:hypothetical protein
MLLNAPGVSFTFFELPGREGFAKKLAGSMYGVVSKTRATRIARYCSAALTSVASGVVGRPMRRLN